MDVLSGVKPGDRLFVRGGGGQRGRVHDVTRTTPKQAYTDSGARFIIETGRRIGSWSDYAAFATAEQIENENLVRRAIKAQRIIASLRITPANIQETEHYLRQIGALKG